jgi:hypothetical protein
VPGGPKPMPSPGGQVSGMGGGVPPRRPPGGLPHGRPWAEPRKIGCGVRRRLPTSVRAVGLRQVDGMALGTQPAVQWVVAELGRLWAVRAVCGPWKVAQQREATLTDGERFRCSTPLLAPGSGGLLGLPEDLVNLMDPTVALAGRADLRDGRSRELLRLGRVGCGVPKVGLHL